MIQLKADREPEAVFVGDVSETPREPPKHDFGMLMERGGFAEEPRGRLIRSEGWRWQQTVTGLQSCPGGSSRP